MSAFTLEMSAFSSAFTSEMSAFSLVSTAEMSFFSSAFTSEMSAFSLVSTAEIIFHVAASTAVATAAPVVMTTPATEAMMVRVVSSILGLYLQGGSCIVAESRIGIRRLGPAGSAPAAVHQHPRRGGRPLRSRPRPRYGRLSATH